MSKIQVNMHEAKSRLSQLAEMANNGDEVVIARAGKPFVNLVSHKQVITERKPGKLKGKIKISDDFNDPSGEIINLFDGGN